MGMAASQARYLALTARMNDIEYQGQQINQQRTTLSNQINALYNTLLDMDVPTPPATTDFTKVVYSGVQNASKFELDNIVPTGKNSSGKDTFSIDFKYQMAGHAVAKDINTATLTNTSQYLTYKPIGEDSLFKNTIEQVVTIYKAGEAIRTESELPTGNTTGNDIMVAVKASDLILNPNVDYLEVYDNNGKDISGRLPNDDTIVYIKCNSEDINDISGSIANLVTKDTNDEYTNVYKCEKSQKTEVRELTDEAVLKMGLYFVSDINNKSSVPEQITTYTQLKSIIENSGYSQIFQRDLSGEGTQFTNPIYNSSNTTGWMVGDMPVMEMNDARIQIFNSYEDYITALKHSFPEYANMTDEEVASKFLVYIEKSTSGTNIPHFIKKDEISAFAYNDSTSVRSYKYDQSGTYTNVENKKNCEIEFDVNTGRIVRVGVPDGNGQVIWIKIECETQTDNKAYEDAFNQYEYKKLLYDKKQQEINAKTSIIQSEDKNLELKLTRLDNERNAVHTELEAVKKVIDDNIENSFKTFNA